MIVENIINVDFNANRPLEKLSKTNLFSFGKTMLYLSNIMDLQSWDIIAYTISDKQELKYVLHTLHQLSKLYESCILHRDQGAVLQHTHIKWR